VQLFLEANPGESAGAVRARLETALSTVTARQACDASAGTACGRRRRRGGQQLLHLHHRRPRPLRGLRTGRSTWRSERPQLNVAALSVDEVHSVEVVQEKAPVDWSGLLRCRHAGEDREAAPRWRPASQSVSRQSRRASTRTSSHLWWLKDN